MDDKFIDYNNYLCGVEQPILLRNKRESRIYVLPESGIIEVEAFKINDDIKKPDLSSIDNLPNFNLSVEPICSIVKQCKELSKEFEVMIKLNGPLTIISELIGLNNLFLLWIKSPNKFYDILKNISDNLILYVNECVSSGAAIISYGDAICSLNILGLKRLRDITIKFSHPFLKNIETVINKRALLHLCPKISGALNHFNLAETKIIKLDKKMNYEEACLYINGIETIVGSKCIEYRDIKVENIEVINLK